MPNDVKKYKILEYSSTIIPGRIFNAEKGIVSLRNSNGVLMLLTLNESCKVDSDVERIVGSYLTLIPHDIDCEMIISKE